MPINAGDAERADYERAHVLGLAENKGYECITNALNTMIERERERVEALTLDEKENLIARARLSALLEVTKIPADIIETSDKILIEWENRFNK